MKMNNCKSFPKVIEKSIINDEKICIEMAMKFSKSNEELGIIDK